MTTSSWDSLQDFLETSKNYFNRGNRPDSCHSPFGRLKCEYKNDPDEGDVPYVKLTMPQPFLPEDCYAEIDGETYGTFIGFRIYLDAD